MKTVLVAAARRIAFRGAYSVNLYQDFASSTVGNSSTTLESTGSFSIIAWR